MRPPEFEGSRTIIRCAERPNGSCPAGDFLDGLSMEQRKKLDVMFERLGEGYRLSKPRFRKLRDSDGVYEFKVGQVRIFGFWSGREMFLVSGEIKKSNKLPGHVLKRVGSLAAEFRQQQGVGR